MTRAQLILTTRAWRHLNELGRARARRKHDSSALMALDPQLLDLLACPEDHGPLWYFAAERLLYNPRLRRKYPIENDVPILLSAKAIALGEREHEQLVRQRATAKDSTSDFFSFTSLE